MLKLHVVIESMSVGFWWKLVSVSKKLVSMYLMKDSICLLKASQHVLKPSWYGLGKSRSVFCWWKLVSMLLVKLGNQQGDIQSVKQICEKVWKICIKCVQAYWHWTAKLWTLTIIRSYWQRLYSPVTPTELMVRLIYKQYTHNTAIMTI